jgi:hypothetical protein
MGRHLKNKELTSPGYSLALTGGPDSLRPTSPIDGQIRYNTEDANIEVYYDNVWNALARIGPVTVVKDTFVGDGVTSEFTMSRTYISGQETRVVAVVGNIFQNPGVAFVFTGVLGSPNATIAFASPPPFGQTIIVLHGYASTDAALS